MHILHVYILNDTLYTLREMSYRMSNNYIECAVCHDHNIYVHVTGNTNYIPTLQYAHVLNF